MDRRRSLIPVFGLLFTAAAPALSAPPPPEAADPLSPAPWHLTGKLSEGCSCAVPCACNFGQNPSPHSFCYAVFGMTIDSGTYGDTKLDGLRLAGVQAEKGVVLYTDARATKEQADALKAISRVLWVKALKANGVTDLKKPPAGFALLAIKPARIEHTIGEKSNHLLIENAGRLDADYITGIDGKTPVVVSNNYSWNIQDGIKAKTRILRYHDSYGNRMNFAGTNSNQGKFDWTDQTPVYFR